jgi:protein NirF
VGVKTWNNFLVFSLMDKNEIWVMDVNNDFKIVHKVQNAGSLPFDALIKDNLYILGFFNEGAVGVLDLANFSYKKIELSRSTDNTTYKVPHFGYWGIVDDTAVVPMVASKKIILIDLKKIKPIREVDLIGQPVFATVSPDKKSVVVSYSGEQEDYISVLETSKYSTRNDIKAGQRIMHFRYSNNGDYFYTSSYFENKVNVFETKNWKKTNSISVSTPSGIFIRE